MNRKIWIIGLLILLICGCTETSEEPTINKFGEYYEADLGTACFMSQDFVEKRLKSPGSAEFQSCKKEEYGGVMVRYLGNQTYYTRGYVDSQNGFGALIRSNYRTEILDNQDETWTLKDIDVWQ